jgi:hypothetical protein
VEVSMKKKIDPELRARWAEEGRSLCEMYERRLRQIAARRRPRPGTGSACAG